MTPPVTRTPPPNPGPAEPAFLVDLHGLAAGVRWRRRMWTGLAVAGLLVGAAAGTVLPGRATATATIYVAHENEQAGDRQVLMQTDLAVLTTTQVAGAAAARLGSPESPEEFLDSFSGASRAANILTVTAHDDADAAALARVGAVADAFIADHVQRSTDAAAASRDAYLAQRDKAATELAQVDGEIAAAAPTNDANVANLYARRSSLQSNIGNFESQAAQAGVGAPRVAAGTVVVDGPRVTSRSFLMSAVVGGGLGMVLGLGLGLLLALVATAVGDRPVLRRDIAANLGASVVAQLPRARLLGRLRPGRTRRDVAATTARLIAAGDEGAARRTALLELGCRRTAAALAVDVAAALAQRGPVTLVDDLPGGRVAAAAGRRRDGGAEIDVADGAEATATDTRGRRRVGVGTVAPGCAWTDLPHLGDEALLVVAAGAASTTWLHTVARRLADERVAVVGIVLVHPDPRDRTDGALWDAVHTTLRGRAAAAAEPAATNGVRLNGHDRNGFGTLPSDQHALDRTDH